MPKSCRACQLRMYCSLASGTLRFSMEAWASRIWRAICGVVQGEEGRREGKGKEDKGRGGRRIQEEEEERKGGERGKGREDKGRGGRRVREEEEERKGGERGKGREDKGRGGRRVRKRKERGKGGQEVQRVMEREEKGSYYNSLIVSIACTSFDFFLFKSRGLTRSSGFSSSCGEGSKHTTW